MSSERHYPPRFANDDPERAAAAMGAELDRIQALRAREPGRAEAEFELLLEEIKREKAARRAPGA